jgi:hypothetical protein
MRNTSFPFLTPTVMRNTSFPFLIPTVNENIIYHYYSISGSRMCLPFLAIANTFSVDTMSNVTSVGSTNVDLASLIKYVVLQTCHIPSIFCSIFKLAHLLLDHNLRSALHNHVLLALMIISILDSFLSHPFTLNYLRLGYVTPSTNALCLFWNFINSNCSFATYLTMAWASVERHFLIFYPSIFTTRRQRILFHYIPLLITALVYPIMFSTVIVFLYPCSDEFNMTAIFCGYSCALRIPYIVIYARIAHNFVPTFIVVGSSLALLVRVIMQKRRVLRNQFTWRRCRRMIIQLMTIASLFLIVTMPVTFVSIVQYCCSPTFGAAVQVPYLSFLIRFLNMLMPFVCLGLLPEIWPKLLPCKTQSGRVAPIRTRTNILSKT